MAQNEDSIHNCFRDGTTPFKSNETPKSNSSDDLVKSTSAEKLPGTQHTASQFLSAGVKHFGEDDKFNEGKI